MANLRLVTTGLTPLTLGSIETFQLSPTINGLPWNLLLGSVTLTLSNPNSVQTILPATISSDGSSATVSWTVAGVEGAWLRTWTVTDSQGRRQVSQPIVFNVAASPG